MNLLWIVTDEDEESRDGLKRTSICNLSCISTTASSKSAMTIIIIKNEWLLNEFIKKIYEKVEQNHELIVEELPWINDDIYLTNDHQDDQVENFVQNDAIHFHLDFNKLVFLIFIFKKISTCFCIIHISITQFYCINIR
jgi:hypothetical protein